MMIFISCVFVLFAPLDGLDMKLIQ